jgi:Arc/MetJ family transcription regulator
VLFKCTIVQPTAGIALVGGCSQLTDIYNVHKMYTHEQWGNFMAVALTSIRLDKRLADEAAEVLGVNSRTEAVHVALREIVALRRFKKLMSKYGGRLDFSGHDE